MRRLLVALALVVSGCAFNVTANGTLFKDSAGHARDLETANRALAERLLCGGYDPAAVEQILVLNGSTPDDARKVVAVARAGAACALKGAAQ